MTVQESDQPAITDDRLARRPFQRLIRLVRRSTTVPFLSWQNEKIRLDERPMGQGAVKLDSLKYAEGKKGRV